MPLHFKKAFALRDNKIQEVDDNEVDVELLSSNNFFSTHINLIPMHSAVQGPRLFYGARFYNQALPLVNPDAPLVQNLDSQDKDGQSFDEKLGKIAGSVIADDDGEVVDLTNDFVKLRKADGSIKSFDLYNNFPFNRKSVSGTSTVLIKRDGAISKYNIEDYVFEKGDRVLSYDTENKKSAWQEVTAYLKHTNDKKLYTVAFESGRSVTVTEDHSLLTLDRNCNIVPVYPLDCIVNRTKSPVAFGNIEETGGEKDRDLGTLVGLYLAEGSLGKQKGLVSIAVQSEVRSAEAKELVRRVLGVKPHDALVNCSFTSHEFQRFLRDNCGSGSSNKFISNTILSKSRAYLEGLICGYMAGDGCLWADTNGALQLTAVTVSKKLRDDLVDVLNILGVFTTLFDVPRSHINDKWNDGYGFRIISCHANKLARWFFYNDRHIKFNAIVKSKYRASPFEHIPLVPEAKKNLYKSFASKVPHFVYKSAFIGAVSKHRLTASKGNFGLLANSDLLWDKIISIVPAPYEAFVYDLEVNSSEAFAVNGGLLVHNTAITHKPLINKGDVVTKGQMLAKSNYTSDNGSLALGANARVGLVPFKGYSMDDAIVVSNSFAKRLTSDHSYTMEQDYDNDVKGGLNHYVSLFPTQFTKDQLKRFDPSGVVKPGTVVKQGDPLILATRPRVFSSTTAQLGKLSKAMRQSRHDSSQIWDSEFDGTVTDVAKTKTGYKVIVKSEAPAQMGDKIVFRSGQKGVIANILSDDHMPRTKDGAPLEVLLNPLGIPCYDSETEFLTDTGWIPAAEVNEEHKVATLNTKTFCIEFQKPTEIHHIPYEGLMYKFVNQQLDILVTPEHNQFSAPRSSPKIYGSITPSDSAVWPLFELNKAKDIFGQPRRYAKAALWQGHTPSEFYIPSGSVKCNTNKPKDGFYVDAEKWVKFMGWYISEGSAYINKGKKGNSYTVEISQSLMANPDKYSEISELLDSMPFDYVYKGKTGFRIFHKGLYEKLSILGKARDKYIPRDILDLSPKFLHLFLSCAIKGDGNKYSNAKTGHVDCLTYTTASKTLAGNIQEITAKLGISVNVKKENRRGCQACYYLSLKKRSPFVWTNWSAKTKQADRQEEAWISYKGLVHCVTVPNGVLFVRRNGKAVFSGNSRVNNGIIYELLLGKAAAKMGQPVKVPSFNKPGEKWYDFVAKTLKDNDLAETEEVFDPMSNKLLENPITVGVGHVLKLHHTSASKASARGQGGYDLDQQPLKGGSEAAQAKRLSGLEVHSLLSAGAYKTLKEGATLRGQKNDEYWRALRQGYQPKPPGAPFAWEKFQTLLTGAGLQARKVDGGKLRLGPFTDDDLDKRGAVDIKSGDLVDMNTMDPVPGGLFDQSVVGNNKWGKISLPFKVPNPAFEPAVRHLLGLTEKELRGIMSGQMELPAHLR